MNQIPFWRNPSLGYSRLVRPGKVRIRSVGARARPNNGSRSPRWLSCAAAATSAVGGRQLGKTLALTPALSPRGSSLPTSRPAEHRGFLASISPVQIRILEIRNPNQIPKAENPNFKTSTVIFGSLGDSSAFSWFRIWDLFRISSFGFRISLLDRRCPANKIWDMFSPQWGRGMG